MEPLSSSQNRVAMKHHLLLPLLLLGTVSALHLSESSPSLPVSFLPSPLS